MSEKYQMMAPDDIRDCCDRIGRLRTLLVYFIILQGITIGIFLFTVLGIYFDFEFMVKWIEFIQKHDSVIMIISIASTGVAFLYYAELMCLNRLDNNLLVAGVLGIVTFLYGGLMASLYGVDSSSYASVLTKISYTKSFVVLIMAVVFRRIYYSAMSSRTWPLSEEVSALWKRLWDFTLKVYVGTAIVLVALKLVMERIIKNAEKNSFKYDDSTQKVIGILLFVIIVAASILEIVMQCRERKCLEETSECLFSLPPTSEKSE